MFCLIFSHDLIQFMPLSRISQKAYCILHSASHLGAHLVFIVVCLFVLLLSMLLVMLTFDPLGQYTLFTLKSGS